MNELSGLLGGLVSIDSVNPDLVPGANGEGDDRFVRRGLAAKSAGWRCT